MEGVHYLMMKFSQNSMIEVSVVIVNYNTGKLLQECVDAVIKTTKNLSFPKTEILIVDNNSTDGSANFKGNFTLIKNQDNPGFSKANNQAIKKAKGEYILLLNPDTKVLGLVIEQLIEFAKTHPDAGVVAPRLLNSDGSVQDSVMPFPTISRAIQEFWFGKKVYSKYVPNVKSPIEIEAAVMAGFLITPSARKKVGMLNEKYFMYFEDLDYCRSVYDVGLKIYYLPNAKVIHYQGVSGEKLALNKDQWKRLIPGSKIYHGVFKYYLITLIIKTSQKFF